MITARADSRCPSPISSARGLRSQVRRRAPVPTISWAPNFWAWLVARAARSIPARSEEHTSELQSRRDLVCRLLLEKKKSSKQSRTEIPQTTSEHRACLGSVKNRITFHRLQ